jgi:hypothetical protein
MTKSITTKIDDETYQKLIEKCESSNENKCQYLKRMIENNVKVKNVDKVIISDLKSKGDYKVTTSNDKKVKFDNNHMTKVNEGVWKNKDGVIITLR